LASFQIPKSVCAKYSAYTKPNMDAWQRTFVRQRKPGTKPRRKPRRKPENRKTGDRRDVPHNLKAGRPVFRPRPLGSHEHFSLGLLPINTAGSGFAETHTGPDVHVQCLLCGSNVGKSALNCSSKPTSWVSSSKARSL
jgi:hypothetical protein